MRPPGTQKNKGRSKFTEKTQGQISQTNMQ